MARTRRLAILCIAAAAPLVAGCPSPDGGLDGDARRDAGAERAVESALPTALWHDATDVVLDSTAEWTNKVELADLDGDGLVDLLFANGGDYSEPGAPELNRVFRNRGAGERFEEITEAVLGTAPDLTRVIRARDLNGDGHVDIFVGNTYQTQSRLFMGEGGGRFVERTATHLPRTPLSLGDVAVGDVDGDGTLDLVLADWGPGNNMTNDGGRTRLWLNDGTGIFTDVTGQRMPQTLVRFSWDIELVDVDNDLALDIVVSCKRCAGSMLFRNDGMGTFREDPRALPQYTNNYELEAMDLDGDGFLDLVTINDGDIVGERGSSRREHVFRNAGDGTFRDATDVWWPDEENIGEDDNVVAFLDFDSDGDADFLIGSLSGPDRLLVNDGTGRLSVATDVFDGAETPGTLGMAVGDLDADGRLDVVQSQGEHPTAVQERIFFGRGLASDTTPPVVTLARAVGFGGALLVRARVHDRKSPTLPTEWRSVEVLYEVQGERGSEPMVWYGEYLWRAIVPPDATALEVCATDAAGNTTCVAAAEPTR
jgi:hypothetical protein